MKKNTTVANNQNVVYHVSGAGKALMLIHGFGFDGSAWNPLLPALEQHAKVIRVELPGFGGSDLPKGEPSIDAYADAVAAVIKNENIDSCCVAGHSMGGYVALNLLERYNGLVECLCLFHSHPFPDDDARKEKRLKDAEFIERNGSEKFIPVLINALVGEAFKQKHANAVNDLVEQFKSLDANGLVYALKAMRNRSDRSRALAQLKNPLMQIIGMKDKAVPTELTFKTLELTNASTLSLSDVGHLGMYESTVLCATYISNWLDDSNKIKSR